MTFIFWQNTLSIHQSAFLRSLAETHNVILISEKDIDPIRVNHGFHIPDFGKTQVIISPNDNEITKLFEIDAIHIISGVQAFKLPNRAFKFAVKKNLTVGIFSESFNWMGVKGKLRFFKYWLFRVRYNKRISFILTTGKRGRWCFESVGFDKAKIYDWAYFPETPIISDFKDASGKPKLLYIGRIDKRKNILSLIEACKQLDIIDQLSIVGVGQLESTLQQNIVGTQCNYIGKVPNKEIHQIIVDSDVLILPSLYDGWGAVVNEALLCGTPVIASDNCGSSILLQGIRGRVFSMKNNDLKKILQEFIIELPYYNVEKRNEIRNWALQNISGETAAKYFADIINHVLQKSKQKPLAPWLS